MFLALVVGFDGDRPATGVRAHPFDADGAAAGADVPEQLAGAGRQARQGHGADVALGQLAVVAIGFVGQARGQRQAHGAGAGAAFHRHQVGDRRRAAAASRRRGRRDGARGGPPRCSSTLRRLAPKPRALNRRAMAAGLSPSLLRTSRRRPSWTCACSAASGRATSDRQATSCRAQPRRAAASGGGGRRQDPQFGRRQLPGETGADAEQHRVAAGQHAGRLAAPEPAMVPGRTASARFRGRRRCTAAAVPAGAPRRRSGWLAAGHAGPACRGRDNRPRRCPPGSARRRRVCR